MWCRRIQSSVFRRRKCDAHHIQRCNVRTRLCHRVLHAVRVGGHAAEVLRSDRWGEVVSGFRNGVNSRFTVDDRASLIAFQTADVAFHPWAVEIQPAATPTASPLSSFAWADSPSSQKPESSHPTLTAVLLHDREGEIKVYLDTAAVLPLKIVPFDRGQAKGARKMTPCLVERIHVALGRLPARRENEILDERIESIVARFKEGGRSGALVELIGLGSGATPSGDDVLVGLLAALAAWEKRSRQARMLRTYLREKLPAIALRTTPKLSAQMIVAACDGAFAEPVLRFIDASAAPAPSIIVDTIERIAALGHQSGLRMLQGLALGWDHAAAPSARERLSRDQ